MSRAGVYSRRERRTAARPPQLRCRRCSTPARRFRLATVYAATANPVAVPSRHDIERRQEREPAFARLIVGRKRCENDRRRRLDIARRRARRSLATTPTGKPPPQRIEKREQEARDEHDDKRGAQNLIRLSADQDLFEVVRADDAPPLEAGDEIFLRYGK